MRFLRVFITASLGYFVCCFHAQSLVIFWVCFCNWVNGKSRLQTEPYCVYEDVKLYSLFVCACVLVMICLSVCVCPCLCVSFCHDTYPNTCVQVIDWWGEILLKPSQEAPEPVSMCSQYNASLQTEHFIIHFISYTAAELSGAVYCYRSCLFASGGRRVFVCVCLWVCYHDNSKLRASILTKLGL